MAVFLLLAERFFSLNDNRNIITPKRTNRKREKNNSKKSDGLDYYILYIYFCECVCMKKTPHTNRPSFISPVCIRFSSLSFPFYVYVFFLWCVCVRTPRQVQFLKWTEKIFLLYLLFTFDNFYVCFLLCLCVTFNPLNKFAPPQS